MEWVSENLTLAYKLGGLLSQNAYVNTKIAKKDQIDIGIFKIQYAWRKILFTKKESLRERNSEMKEILNQYKKFGEADKFRSCIGKSDSGLWSKNF